MKPEEIKKCRCPHNHPQRDILPFLYVGVPVAISLEKMSVPPGETGNPRCK